MLSSLHAVSGKKQAVLSESLGLPAGVKPSSHELLPRHLEQKPRTLRPGCCAKKPSLGGRAGHPGRKASQEVKLYYQCKRLGKDMACLGK